MHFDPLFFVTISREQKIEVFQKKNIRPEQRVRYDSVPTWKREKENPRHCLEFPF